MTDMTEFPPLPSNFIVYDHTNPSPYFPVQRVAYIESFKAGFSDEEIKRIRTMEQFTLNLHTNWGGNTEIPGIRITPEKMHVYFKRFSSGRWVSDVSKLMDCIPEDFGDKGKCLIPMCRTTLPSGDRYYPMALRGDLEEWARLLERAARACGTKLARFDQGKFVVSDGQTISFSDLTWDRLLHRQRPGKKW